MEALLMVNSYVRNFNLNFSESRVLTITPWNLAFLASFCGSVVALSVSNLEVVGSGPRSRYVRRDAEPSKS